MESRIVIKFIVIWRCCWECTECVCVCFFFAILDKVKLNTIDCNEIQTKGKPKTNDGIWTTLWSLPLLLAFVFKDSIGGGVDCLDFLIVPSLTIHTSICFYSIVGPFPLSLCLCSCYCFYCFIYRTFIFFFNLNSFENLVLIFL